MDISFFPIFLLHVLQTHAIDVLFIETPRSETRFRDGITDGFSK